MSKWRCINKPTLGHSNPLLLGKCNLLLWMCYIDLTLGRLGPDLFFSVWPCCGSSSKMLDLTFSYNASFIRSSGQVDGELYTPLTPHTDSHLQAGGLQAQTNDINTIHWSFLLTFDNTDSRLLFSRFPCLQAFYICA